MLYGDQYLNFKKILHGLMGSLEVTRNICGGNLQQLSNAINKVMQPLDSNIQLQIPLAIEDSFRDICKDLYNVYICID